MLLLGGQSDIYFSRCAEMLFQLDDGGGSETWRWRTLAPMNNERRKPGVLRLDNLGDAKGVQKVLVVGGRTNTAEMLTISCSDEADLGQWTLIEPLRWMTKCAFLAATNRRILAFGESLC